MKTVAVVELVELVAELELEPVLVLELELELGLERVVVVAVAAAELNEVVELEPLPNLVGASLITRKRRRVSIF